MDESFSIWYGLVGYCINLVIEHYVYMDLNLDASCKFKDTFCGRIMLILKLRLVEDKDEDVAASSANRTATSLDDNYGTKVLK